MDSYNRETDRQERPVYGSYQSSSPASPPSPARKTNLKDTLSTLGVIILAPLVAFFLTAFVFQSYQVDGPSMEATLQDRDRLIVSKIGRTFSRLTGKDYAPERYDIVIFNHNDEFGGEVSEKQLIKRVIGLPGDRVVVNDGAVTVYNTENPDGIPVDQAGPQKDSVDTATPGNTEETVKPGEVYAMGGNRDNSLDSRSFGAIREADIVGKLVLRIYPFDKSQKY